MSFNQDGKPKNRPKNWCRWNQLEVNWMSVFWTEWWSRQPVAVSVFCGFTSAERSESTHDFGDFTHHQKQDPNVPPGFGVTNFQEFSGCFRSSRETSNSPGCSLFSGSPDWHCGRHLGGQCGSLSSGGHGRVCSTKIIGITHESWGSFNESLANMAIFSDFLIPWSSSSDVF